MHIGVCCPWCVVVHDEIDSFNVQPTGGDVSRDEDGAGVGGGGGEAFHGAETGLLRHGGVEGEGWELEGLEKLGGSADGGDGVCEDQCAVFGVVKEEGVEVEVFLHRAAFDDAFFQVFSHL